MKHKILFVHGFGVKKDSRGMFTDIADFLSTTSKCKDSEMVLFDMNEIDLMGEDILVNPLSQQAEILKQKYKTINSHNTEIDIIAHSQGCVVTALAKLPKLRKVILLAPPTNNDLQKTINFFKERPGTKIDTEGESYISRADGAITRVPKEYWEDRKSLIYADEYKRLSNNHDVSIVFANQDKIVNPTYIDQYKGLAKVVQIDGNHNFDSPNREGLLQTLHELL